MIFNSRNAMIGLLELSSKCSTITVWQ